MHPILGNSRLLRLYLAIWVPLTGLLVMAVRAGSGAGWVGASVLVAPLAVLFAFLCLAAWYPCRANPLDRVPVWRAAAVHATSALFITGFWVVNGQVWAMLVDGPALVPDAAAVFQRMLGALFATGVLVYLLAVAASYAMISFRQAQASEREALESRLQAREAELRALKAQLDPHFLFNSLNSISSLAGTDSGRAREMAGRLAEFLRASLRRDATEPVTLGEEAALAEAYLKIEQVRYGDRLRYSVEIPGALAATPVPPLVLQPLVENAVKHGIAGLVEGGTVRILAGRRGRELVVMVENPVDTQPAVRDEAGEGIGLANAAARLRAMVGEPADLRVHCQEGLFRVELAMPLADDPAGGGAK